MRPTRRVIIVAVGAICLGVAAAAGAAASTGAGAVAVTRATAQGVTTPTGPPGAGDVSAIGAAQAGSWGRAIEVPGLGALNKGGDALVRSVSCASAGSCSAGGDYTDRRGLGQGFVVSERHGRWGTAIEVPGLGALNTSRDATVPAEVSEVSCSSAGNCAAGGYYADRSNNQQGFVAVERHGRWGKAIKMPGPGGLSKGFSHVFSVSCAPAGGCAAGGDYGDRRGNGQGFVAVELRGRWGKPIEVPGLGALNKGSAEVTSVSCASAGSCVAGGYYTDRRGGNQGFVAVERNGRWGTAIEVPGLGALNTGGDAEVTWVSCASAGNCVAGGHYADPTDLDLQGFVAVERNGRWGTAIEVPGLGALNKGDAGVNSVSCAPAGNCAAGGNYTVLASGANQGFVAVERHGRWGTAIEVPGLGALNKGDAGVNSVSCAPAGNCAAGGNYSAVGGDSGLQGFVAVERDGRWGTAIEVPGLGALNTGGDANVFSVSCAPAGNCAAGGIYLARRGHYQGFVVSWTG